MIDYERCIKEYEEIIRKRYEFFGKEVEKVHKQLIDNHCSKCANPYTLIEKDGEFLIKKYCDECVFMRAAMEYCQGIKLQLKL